MKIFLYYCVTENCSERWERKASHHSPSYFRDNFGSYLRCERCQNVLRLEKEKKKEESTNGTEGMDKNMAEEAKAEGIV